MGKFGPSLGIFLLRGMIGITMILHGYNHIFRGGKIKGTAGWFESLGMKPGTLHAWLASLTELGAGALLILGMFTPLAAAGVVGVMAVALVTNHLKNGFFIFRPGEGYEYVLNLLVAGLAIGATGAGGWSIDFAVFDNGIGPIGLAGMTGFVIAAGAGLGGAALLLAAFWRPNAGPKDEPTAAVEDPPSTEMVAEA